MPITINPPAAVAAHRRQGEGSSPLADFFPAGADHILYGGRPVKEALDELFAAFGTVAIPERGWQKFTESGDFTVPEGVTRVLVLCIGAGSSTASTRGGGVLVSRHLAVTPGETIPVQVGVTQTPGKQVYGNATLIEQLCSSFNGTTLKASWRGIYHVDGTQYTFANASPAIPEELRTKGVVTLGAVPGSATATTSYRGTAGTGGYAVAADVPDERVAWLELARDMPPGTAPSGRKCYPDATQLAGNYSDDKAGTGANYGGSAGCWSLSNGYAKNAAKGGAGLVCVFWGDDIDKAPQAEEDAAVLHKKEAAALTPLHPLYDAGLIPYVNDAAGLAAGSTVADALDVLASRLTEQEQSA